MPMNNNSSITIDLNAILGGLTHLDTSSLHGFANEVVKMLLGRIPDHRQEKEWSLIYQIYTVVPPDTHSRYHDLVPKLETEELTESERKEFLALHEQMESYSAERLKLLSELATIREIPLKTVMQQLGL